MPRLYKFERLWTLSEKRLDVTWDPIAERYSYAVYGMGKMHPVPARQALEDPEFKRLRSTLQAIRRLAELA